MPVVELKSADYEANFRFLMAVARGASAPGFSIDGKTEKDLLKLAATLPGKPLSAENQRQIDVMFSKPQTGYRRTGYNLAHRSNQITAANRNRARFSPGLVDAISKLGADRHAGDVSATAARALP